MESNHERAMELIAAQESYATFRTVKGHGGPESVLAFSKIPAWNELSALGASPEDAGAALFLHGIQWKPKIRVLCAVEACTTLDGMVLLLKTTLVSLQAGNLQKICVDEEPLGDPFWGGSEAFPLCLGLQNRSLRILEGRVSRTRPQSFKIPFSVSDRTGGFRAGAICGCLTKKDTVEMHLSWSKKLPARD
jgi:hypothetical protein